ncbi:MAG: transcriptional regulator [Deltaproteobacteria bacterium]|nr:transcriptional regulator [Deltaproteobacteria bacterium]
MTEEKESTLRRRIQEVLLTESCTVRDLSQLLRASEKEILSHLPNVARSASHSHKFEIIPAECLECGFTFKRRSRFTVPGKCPLCRSRRISPPRFRIL